MHIILIFKPWVDDHLWILLTLDSKSELNIQNQTSLEICNQNGSLKKFEKVPNWKKLIIILSV